MISYAIEFRDHTGHGFPRPERTGLTKQRSIDIAEAFCLKYPDRMCFIYAEEEKWAGLYKGGGRKTAVRVNTELRVFGRAYRGSKLNPSTMQKKARGRTDRAVYQTQDLVVGAKRSW